MARVTLKLESPIDRYTFNDETQLIFNKPLTELQFDIERHSLEAVGYVKPVFCRNCEFKDEELDWCWKWLNEIEDDGYCKWGKEKEE